MTGFLDMPPMPAPIVITDDRGGDVGQYSYAARLYTRQKRRVEIRGSCRSACLLALSVPNVCVTDGSLVKAHHAYEKKTGIIRADVTKQMLDTLPAPIQRALDGKIEKDYTAEATLGYWQLRVLGVPDCSVRSKISQASTPTLVIRRPGETTARPIRPEALLNRIAIRVAQAPLNFLKRLAGRHGSRASTERGG